MGTREMIVRTASMLFYRQGYSNTGINQIIEEAGVAKSTLYQQFRSKEDILLVYLEETGETTMEGLRAAAEERARVQMKKQKDLVRDLFVELLAPAGKEGLADALYTLFEGALIGHKIHRDGWPIGAARRAAEVLLVGSDFLGFAKNKSVCF
jgi:AcrR family transcriptional regulator